MAEVNPLLVYGGEAQLLSWRDSNSSGPQITLLLPDADALDAFKRLTLAKKNMAGHRLALAVYEIGDDELPVRQPVPQATQAPAAPEKRKGGPLAVLAAAFCRDERFWAWIWETHDQHIDSEALAADWLRAYLDIKSRSEIDSKCPEMFHANVRLPYHSFILAEHGQGA